jgi:predicted nucleotidyltransferase
MAQASVKTITAILDHILKESVKCWGGDLVSIVLFGSFARGDVRQHSDVDLLLVVEELPKDWRERSAVELSFERMGLQLGTPIQVVLVKPDEVRFAVDDIVPFLLEIRESYYSLLDRDGFFHNEMKRFGEILFARGVRKLAEHKWEVPELARP